MQLKDGLYSNSKPLPKWVKRILIFFLVLLALGYAFGQWMTNYYLNRFEPLYVVVQPCEVLAQPQAGAKSVAQLELWHRVMNPIGDTNPWVEIDRPIHGFVAKSKLANFQGMNEARIALNLPPKTRP